ncbi:putative Transmembrane protease serine 6 [Hypsibius exemplaris]|uniref:limulus clotting factor C n=1 Tax=Hypsibius exemplaris TaxID=2072580 RepID=A0A1W0X634_HYPEX|nr:putative Transmembrane protease serine 6 [Hypsibius exemplaris]
MATLASLLVVVFVAVFVQSSDGACTRNVTIGPDVSVINSDNFPFNYDDYTACRWYITGPADTQLTLTFIQDFEVEAGSSADLLRCPHDKVTIFDTARPGATEAVAASRVCRSADSIVVSHGPFCGVGLPAPVVLGRNTAVVEFCSDYGVTGLGWQINLSYVPLSSLPQPEPWITPTITLASLTEESVINSPNYPAVYPKDYSADYIILNTQRDKAVVIRPIIFDLGRDCCDKLTITDVTNNQTYVFCGDNAFEEPLDLSRTEEIRIRLTTDPFDDGETGFSLGLSLLNCARSEFACDDNNGCYNPNSSCDGVRHCADGSDEKWEYCYPECGKSHFPMNSETANKITGGEEVNRYSVPWQAAMLEPSGRQFCGGSVISDRWILTAAHCFQGSGRYKVRLGGHNLEISAVNDRAVEIEVEKVICHPSYNTPSTLDHDSCLLKLKETIPFRKNIAPICLPRQNADVEPGTICMSSGWGRSRTAGGSLDGLREIYVPVIERGLCGRIYAASSITYPVTQQMICAGSPQWDKDSCPGDSGGPFACRNNGGRWTVNGIVSWGGVCHRNEVPGVYANTGSMTNWLVQTMATN